VLKLLFGNSRSLIYEATKEGDTETVINLIKANHNVNKTGEYNNSPLHLAIIYRHDDILDVLLAHNAKPNSTNEHGITPLQIAVYYGCTKNIRKLLEKGAHPDTYNKVGSTALLIAVKYKNVGAVKLLLEFNADFTKTNNNFSTPLYIAAINGDEDSEKLLLAAGAKANAKHNHDKCPGVMAAYNGHYKVSNILFSHRYNTRQKEQEKKLAEANRKMVSTDTILNGTKPCKAETIATTAENMTNKASRKIKREVFEIETPDNSQKQKSPRF